MKKIPLTREFWLVLSSILLLAAVLASIDSSGNWWQGWLAYSILLGMAALGIIAAWKAVKPSQKATQIALIAFLLRLGVGVILALLLPNIGYQDNQEHLAGYVYTDAFIRDNQAWELASSGDSLGQAFTGKYTGDQYGGMLAISALIYRTFSPDAHRPILVLILGAAFSAVGILCLWKASRLWFDEKTTQLVLWIFALYPESLLLGSSQMREAIVIPLTAVAFFALTEIQGRRREGWVWLFLASLLMFLIQPLAGFVSLAVLFGVWLLDPSTWNTSKQRHTILVIFLLIAVLLVIMLLVSSILANLPSLQESKLVGTFITWFRNNFAYQSYLTERASGMFQSLLTSMGESWRWLIVLVYGIAQPVLPAIVGDPDAAWIMRIIGFLRAAGWYALALFLVYGTLGALRSRTELRRLQLVWISLVSWAWIMVAALNAGADQWDNPRYRVILLLWQVMLAAWAWGWARARKDVWLWRWLAVEAVFVGMFTEWYLGRYYPGFPHLDIKLTILLTLVVSALILLGGFIWDKKHTSRLTQPDNRL